ncbi:MAG: hypothetical protein ACLUEU_09840 [Oscillospiraceae bacterium]
MSETPIFRHHAELSRQIRELLKDGAVREQTAIYLPAQAGSGLQSWSLPLEEDGARTASGFAGKGSAAVRPGRALCRYAEKDSEDFCGCTEIQSAAESQLAAGYDPVNVSEIKGRHGPSLQKGGMDDEGQR